MPRQRATPLDSLPTFYRVVGNELRSAQPISASDANFYFATGSGVPHRLWRKHQDPARMWGYDGVATTARGAWELAARVARADVAERQRALARASEVVEQAQRDRASAHVYLDHANDRLAFVEATLRALPQESDKSGATRATWVARG